jgi:hypothetical protein
MRIVVHDKRFHPSLKGKYILDIKIDYPSIDNSIPLTNKAKEKYKALKNNIGYSTFRGLSIKDIISVLSAVKRQEAHVNVDRMGNCCYYKLHLK